MIVEKRGNSIMRNVFGAVAYYYFSFIYFMDKVFSCVTATAAFH